MKNIEDFKKFKLNESVKLNYCSNCNFLSDTDKCVFCQILDIIGISKKDDVDNIW